MIVIIAAVADNNVIGLDGEIPWSCPDESMHFKNTTLGHPVIMGRKTFESILDNLGKPLPGRRNIVLSHNPVGQDYPNVSWVKDIGEALESGDNWTKMLGVDDMYVAGGQRVYEQFMNYADKLLISYFDQEFAGDKYFPRIDSSDWVEKHSRDHRTYEVRTFVRR